MGIRIAVLLALLASVSGCATLDRDECLAADWYLVGFADAAAGYGAQRIDEHRSACAGHGVIPVLDDYRVGHQKGKHDYCTWEKGYDTGRYGSALNPICDGDLKYDFQQGYGRGREVYDQAQTVSALERDREQLREDRRQARLDKAEKEDQLLADGLARKQRYRLLREIDKLDDRIEGFGHRIARLRRQLQEEQRYLEQLEREAREDR